jgi:RIMS-binding protein 2
MNKDRWGDIYSSNQVRKMIALYDYDPQKLSPNVDAEVELKFTTGDIIYVYGEMDDDGFYLAELRGQRGLVPSNFLADASSNLGGTAAAAAAAVAGTVGGPQLGLGQKLKQQVVGGVVGQSGATGPQPPPRGKQKQRHETSLEANLL